MTRRGASTAPRHPEARRPPAWTGALVTALGLLLVACTSTGPRPTASPVALDAHGQPARILSAFFGLDNRLPFGAHVICLGAAGKDGMPVVLSHTVDEATLEAGDFRVITQAGVESTPLCVTLQPANDPGERRTVLLIGEFGDADRDPPVRVEVVGPLLSDGATGGPVSFRGSSVEVIPLVEGPALIVAEAVPEEQWPALRPGAACPEGTRQLVRASWTGGIRRPDGAPAGEDEGAAYRITVEQADGSRAEVVPVALREVDDRDNNHHLCLDTADRAIAVSFPAGLLVDPNQDLNPATRIHVSHPPAGADAGAEK